MTRDLDSEFARVQKLWTPRIVAEVNGQQVKIARVKGDFVWHKHEVDEMFLVWRGRLTIKFRDGETELGPGQIVVVPANVDHCPCAEEETEIVLFEPAGVLNTGDAPTSHLTVEEPDRA